jgi:hypothetical protein
MAGDSGGGHGATTGVWIATAVIIAGSIVAGIALIEWVWPVFWVGVGLMVAGCIGGYFTNIMDMVSEFSPAPGDVEHS